MWNRWSKSMHQQRRKTKNRRYRKDEQRRRTEDTEEMKKHVRPKVQTQKLMTKHNDVINKTLLINCLKKIIFIFTPHLHQLIQICTH